MATQKPLNFAPFKKAGIGATYLALFCGCSRVSAQLWLTGKANPRGLNRQAVELVLAKVRSALAAGTLPVEPKKNEHPYDAIRKALKRAPAVS
jgi:hypothetical protein